MIGIVIALALAAEPPLPTGAALEQLKASNEAKGMAAAKQGMARGGYGFSPVATPYGMYVMAVAPGSRAAAAGLKSGDDILEINGVSTIGMRIEQLMSALHSQSAGGFDLKLADGGPIHLPPLNTQAVPTAASITNTAASAPPTPAAAPSDSAGCIGSLLDVCLAHMKAAMTVDESNIASQLRRAAETDVNGKAIDDARILVGGASYGSSAAPAVLTIRRDTAGKVSEVELTLRGNPMIAQTAQEYADTGLGVAFRAVLPGSCTADGDLAAFRFFENAVKPTIKIGNKESTIDETHASTDRMSRSSELPYCGANIQFDTMSGYDTNDISEYNEHGAYSISTISFGRPSPSASERHLPIKR